MRRAAQRSRAVVPSYEPSKLAAPRLRAAEYVRMSTDHQRYSIDNQRDAIRAYASINGIDVVETYPDAGKSGLSVGGRSALQRLISDVRARTRAFDIILVYDVTRWGRFQDPDEAAFYEFLCRSAGYDVIYCAEPFRATDPLSSVLKAMKRAMAGEYSRELSVKVFAGAERGARLGRFTGGVPGFGLRRAILLPDGGPGRVLEHGEHKSHTERTVLVPGPASEVALVRRIFRMFAVQRRSSTEIAAILNDEGSKADHGGRWTNQRIDALLRQERYAGRLVWNKASDKLRSPRTRNPETSWVRVLGASPSIISPALFTLAQARLARRTIHMSNTQMLDGLRDLLKREGRLSSALIDDCLDIPSSWTYAARFGNLKAAYGRIGYTSRPRYDTAEVRHAARRHRTLTASAIADWLAELRVRAQVTKDGRRVIVNSIMSIAVHAPCGRKERTRSTSYELYPVSGPPADMLVIARVHSEEDAIRDYFLFPWAVLAVHRYVKLSTGSQRLDAYRCDDVETIARLVAAQAPVPQDELEGC